MYVSADRDDIVTIGSYGSELLYSEYDDENVTISISSIAGKTGVATLSADIFYGDKHIVKEYI